MILNFATIYAGTMPRSKGIVTLQQEVNSQQATYAGWTDVAIDSFLVLHAERGSMVFGSSKAWQLRNSRTRRVDAI